MILATMIASHDILIIFKKDNWDSTFQKLKKKIININNNNQITKDFNRYTRN